MDPVTGGIAAGGALLSLLINGISEALAAGDEAQAQQLREQVAAQYGPELLAQVDAQVAQEAPASEFGDVSEDPSLRGRQLSAVDALRDIYDNEGMGRADQEALGLAQDAVSQNAQSRARSLANSMRQRGMSNSGLEGALMTQASQDSGNALATQGLQAQQMARQRAFQALNASAGMAGDIRGQDAGFGFQRAGGVDTMNRFNAGQRQQAQDQRFRNRMSVLDARGGALMGQAGGLEKRAGNARRVGGAAAGAVQDAAGVFVEDELARRRGR